MKRPAKIETKSRHLVGRSSSAPVKKTTHLISKKVNVIEKLTSILERSNVKIEPYGTENF